MNVMLSVLIPTFNYDCTALVHRLAREARTMDVEVEILVNDDCSTNEAVREANSLLDKVEGCRVFLQDNNLGRAAARNFLAAQARFDWLLFLDADGMPVHERFLASYVESIRKADVVCGSILHPDCCPSPEKALRYRYEKEAERRFTAEKRNRRPYASFRSFNFMISKDAFAKVGFDENFKDYGYEDLLFGSQLREKRISVLHIENPMLNMDIEDNDVFLRKIRESNATLKKFYPQLREGSSLLRAYELLRRLGMHRLAAWLFKHTEKGLSANLLGVNPSLKYLKVYKLLHLASVMAE